MPSMTGKMQHWQRRRSSVSLRMLDLGEMFEHRLAGRLERRAPELLDAEPAPRFIVVDPRHGVVRPHLRPVTAQRGELARHPVAHVDDEGWRFGAVAEGIGGDAPE